MAKVAPHPLSPPPPIPGAERPFFVGFLVLSLAFGGGSPPNVSRNMHFMNALRRNGIFEISLEKLSSTSVDYLVVTVS